MNGVTGVYGHHDTIAGVIPWKHGSRFCEHIVSCFLYSALLWEMWDFLSWFCVIPAEGALKFNNM
jgi:hypothetical protein